MQFIESFADQTEPLSLFTFRLPGHYNANGFKLVAETIYRKFTEEGLMREEEK